MRNHSVYYRSVIAFIGGIVIDFLPRKTGRFKTLNMVSRHQITEEQYEKIVKVGKGNFSRNVTKLLVIKCRIRSVTPTPTWKEGQLLDLVVGCIFKPLLSVRVVITHSEYNESLHKKIYEFEVVKHKDIGQLELNF